MIQTLIVDDVKKNREILVQMLDEYCPQVELIGEADSAETAFQMIQKQTPDLILLDIEMPGETGFDLLERLKGLTFEVIFTTAFDQYALKAIKFCALDYLLKPIQIKELIQGIRKTEEKLRSSQERKQFSYLLENLKNQNSQHNKIALPTQEGLLFIQVDEIIRCEADGSYTEVHLKEKKPILTTRKIKGFEDLLSEHDFFRVHRSHLINLSYIEKYFKGEGGYVIMCDGSNIDVSRRKKEDFLKKLSRI